eukprot:TRINITY_DN14744_c0_g1_i2.p1 TRINITY_DN14744_c0_g1~~TRINITY_DN14744_c0_g1_i2.p1  ORF type:complete len:449 (+),score=26.59 TRINITY_DN14744_c0_g1_i2:80-1348(+)
MPPGHGKVVLRASDVAGGCDPAGGGCGAVPTADTEACAAGQCPLKGPLARECPAPPPRRPTLGRPIFGSTPSAPPAAQSDALPDAPLGAPPDALHESSELPSPAVLGNADKVEHLTTQIQQLRDALAAAEATILQLRAALSAATAQAHPADPGPAAQLAGGGAQEQHKPNGKCRNRRRHRKRGRRQQPGPEEVGAEAQDPEEPAREGQGAKAAAGADPAPRREQRGPTTGKRWKGRRRSLTQRPRRALHQRHPRPASRPPRPPPRPAGSAAGAGCGTTTPPFSAAARSAAAPASERTTTPRPPPHWTLPRAASLIDCSQWEGSTPAQRLAPGPWGRRRRLARTATRCRSVSSLRSAQVTSPPPRPRSVSCRRAGSTPSRSSPCWSPSPRPAPRPCRSPPTPARPWGRSSTQGWRGCARPGRT